MKLFKVYEKNTLSNNKFNVFQCFEFVSNRIKWL